MKVNQIMPCAVAALCSLVLTQSSPADIWYPDLDGDGFGGASGAVISDDQPSGLFTLQGDDHNDEANQAHPGAVEVEDGLDNDGNGIADDGFPGEFVINTGPALSNAGGPYSFEFGTDLTLDASATSDPDDNLAAYFWDLNSDGEFDFATGSPTLTLTHSDYSPFISGPGNYEVKLNAIDDYFGGDTVTAQLTAIPEPSSVVALAGLAAVFLCCRNRRRRRI